MKLNKTLIFITFITLNVIVFSITIKESDKKNLGKESSKKEEVKEVKSSESNLQKPSKQSHVTFDKNVEAEIVGEIKKPVIKTRKVEDAPQANPPKPLSPQKDVPQPAIPDPAENANTNVTGVDDMGPPPTKVKLEPVTYVKELSPAGKASLDLAESGDTEYQKLLNAGFETPKTITQIVNDKSVKVGRAAIMAYPWVSTLPTENKFWENVEFNRYNNRLLDTSRYVTPAKFEKNMFGNIIVHAPSDSDLKITTPAHNILTTQTNIGFLSVDEEEQEVTESELDALTTEHP